MLKLGCHVGMSGKDMMLGSVRDAVSLGQIHLCYTLEHRRIRGARIYRS